MSLSGHLMYVTRTVFFTKNGIPPMSGDLAFVGIVHPDQDPTPASLDVMPNTFCDDNLRDLDLTGLPLFHSHQDSTGKDVTFGTVHKQESLGKVLRTVTGKGGVKIIIGKVGAGNAQAIENIESGKWGELSLQHNFTAEITDKGESQTRTPFEVSFTEKGNRPGCKIIHSHRIPETSSSGSLISQAQKRLENRGMGEPIPAVAAAAAPVAAAAPAPVAAAPAPVAAPLDPATMSMKDMASTEGIAAMGWSGDQVVEAWAASTSALSDAHETIAKLMKDQTNTAQSAQAQLMEKVKKHLSLMKMDAPISEQDESAYMSHYEAPKTVEEADMFSRVVTMDLENKIQSNAKIREQEAELLMLRERVKPTVPPMDLYLSKLKGVHSASAVAEPLADPLKRFASDALVEAARGQVLPPAASAFAQPQVPVMTPQEAFRASFVGGRLDPPSSI